MKLVKYLLAIIIALNFVPNLQAQTYRYKYDYTMRPNGIKTQNKANNQGLGCITFTANMQRFYISDANGNALPSKGFYAYANNVNGDHQYVIQFYAPNGTDQGAFQCLQYGMNRVFGYCRLGQVFFEEDYSVMYDLMSDGTLDVFSRY